MKRFKFKLASIQKIRESEEKHALDAYAQCMQERSRYETRIDSLMNDLVETQKQIIAHREGGVNAGDLLSEHNSMLAIRQQIDEATQALDVVVKKEGEAKEVFLAAKANREILDRLEEKQRNEFEVIERKHEEQEIEDVVIARHNRSMHNFV